MTEPLVPTPSMKLLHFLMAALAAAAALEYALPVRSVAYTGYDAQRAKAFEGKFAPLVSRYSRRCQESRQAAVVQLALEPISAGQAHRTMKYSNTFSNALSGTTVETGIGGWRGLLMPRFLDVALDIPPGEYLACELATPSPVLSSPQLPGLVARHGGVGADTSWKLHANSREQVQALSAAWLELRATLRQQGPAWAEERASSIDQKGAEVLRTEKVVMRYADGQEQLLEFRKTLDDADIVASTTKTLR